MCKQVWSQQGNHFLCCETYADCGIEDILALKRSINSDNARRKVDGRIEARLIEVACSPASEAHSRCTIRLLEDVEKMILVIDNLNTHKPASLCKKYPPEEARRIIR